MTDGDLIADALAFAKEVVGTDLGPRRVSRQPIRDVSAVRAELDSFAAETKKAARGAEAPIAAMELVETAFSMPFDEGIKKERKVFLGLSSSAQSVALSHIFFAERMAAKPPEDVKGAEPRKITSVGIVGAGTMGTGIAMNIADSGLPVMIVELSADALKRGLDRIASSYLDVDAIAQYSDRPQDVVGMHYFSPANVMKLMEVVRGAKTAPDVLVTALAFAKRTGKVSVVSGVCTGFIGNRMFKSCAREAGLLLLEGASPQQVDAALTEFGMAMGPFAVADLTGIDIAYKARASRLFIWEASVSAISCGAEGVVNTIFGRGQARRLLEPIAHCAGVRESQMMREHLQRLMSLNQLPTRCVDPGSLDLGT